MSKSLVLVGPTASGKSEVALRVAAKTGGEIINADSMQVYRFMDIGTAKPSPEDRKRARHHLIDIVDPSEEFSAARFREAALNCIEEIEANGHIPIIAGGTGLYIRALCQGLFHGPAARTELREDLIAVEAQEPGTLFRKLSEVDFAAAAKIHPNDLRRIVRALEVFLASGKKISDLQREWGAGDSGRFVLIGLAWERKELYKRINRRVDAMIEAGLENEVRSLLERGLGPDLKPMKALGYRQMLDYTGGLHSLEQTIELIKQETRHYAKRQMTWFRKEPGILWVECREGMTVAAIAEKVLSIWTEHRGE